MIVRRLISFAVPLALLASFCQAQTLRPDTSVSTVSSQFVTLPGHLAPVLAAAKDLGRVEATMPFEHVAVQLKRSPAQETALEQAIADLHDPKSASYHQWMTAEAYGERFGASADQILQVSDWLTAHGLTVEGTNEARTLVQFSGNASDVEIAFHTEIHTLMVGKTQHVSNVSQPQVPAALASVVAGVGLSDFKPHALVSGIRSLQRNSQARTLKQVGTASPGFTTPVQGGVVELVAPGDFATIYNLNPLWAKGFRGAGQTVAVVEDTLMKTADVATFRKAFGLSQYVGTFTQELPAGSLPCQNPGVNGAESEAALDAEWAGATAPDAAVVLAACADTRTEFGGLIATNNLLSQKTPPQTISMSYGQCEAELGSIQLTEFSNIFEQAVAEGVTVFVSSGDEGPASCNADGYDSTYGINASGFTTTPYDVSVGGTDFYDTAQGTNSKYWSETNSATFTSALSYVPEKTWNDSCADTTLLAYNGYSVAYGAAGFCNNSPGYNYVTTTSGSGAPSAVYNKPTWQAVAGVPADGVRDIPDVSLFAANGVWGHALVFCNSDKATYGIPCDYTNPADAVLDAAGGTSFASPALAGIFALITQQYGRQGNADVGFYKLATAEYGTPASPANAAACNATQGTAVGSTCVFYDVTQGNIDLPCMYVNCFGSSPEYYGVLSQDSTQFTPAYPSTAGWDFATGLGSVNVVNLFNAWSQISPVAASVPRTPIGLRPIPMPVSGTRGLLDQ